MSSDDFDNEILDVAVVGGGVSGVYSAWRLAAARAGKVCLFEQSGRIGGRLLSVTPPGLPHARVELGGMRFTSLHTRVKGLLEQLKIATHSFPVTKPQNICYVRGQRLRQQDTKNPALIPYKLSADEQSLLSQGADFVAVAAERVLRSMLKKDVDLAKVDWKQVAKAADFEGFNLRDLPLHYLLQRNLSNEALRFADDISGYDSILYTWNAADGFPWNLEDFGRDVEYFGITPGFATLPAAIADLFKKIDGSIAADRRIRFGHTLESFDVPEKGNSGLIELQFAIDGGQRRTIKARNLILAMPRKSLELLAKTGPVLGPGNNHVRELIRSVEPIPLFKLALCYDFPWWETIGTVPKIEAGRSITDLPLRQCYYWATDSKTGKAVLLVYDDGRDLDYWSGLRELAKTQVYAAPATASAAVTGDPEWQARQAPDLMVHEVHRQLMEIHGLQHRCDISLPYAAAYRDWGEDPYGGGANFWSLHADSWKVAKEILQPKPPFRVFVCGEAYSHQQGWVEGALRTADDMLRTHFGLDLPT
ncbi:MAG: FAD-dependent oxidoreductase [Bradyrhizobiaceae bacterium]|nr:FAD-dependent oxidoreductase [Bradyrhizobiaceae bacterium]